MSELNRREAIGALAALAGTGNLTVAARQSGLVQAENEKPGAADWQLTDLDGERRGVSPPWLLLV